MSRYEIISDAVTRIGFPNVLAQIVAAYANLTDREKVDQIAYGVDIIISGDNEWVSDMLCVSGRLYADCRFRKIMISSSLTPGVISILPESNFIDMMNQRCLKACIADNLMLYDNGPARVLRYNNLSKKFINFWWSM